MKRISLIMMLLVGFAAYAQKPVKPNLNKALNLWQEGKIAEAKEMIDAATTFEKTMNDGKTYYYKGLIYATIDTIKDEKIHSLEAEPLKVALEAFEKAESMAGKYEYSITPPGAIVPITKGQQIENLANYYLNNAIQTYQDDPEGSLQELGKSRMVFEKHLDKYANDTLAYYVGAIVAGTNDKNQLAIDYSKNYFDKGGKSKDIYNVLYQVYANENPRDNEKILALIRQAKKIHPSDPQYPKMEIELLLNTNQIEKAKTGLEEEIRKNPNDKLVHFYLGYANFSMKDYSAARKNFEDALNLDPTYYEAQVQLANTYLVDVDRVSKELSSTGNTPADSKKRSALVQERVKFSEMAIPQLEKAEKMKAPDKDAEIELLNKLSLVYYYVADDKNTARVQKKLKALGVED